MGGGGGRGVAACDQEKNVEWNLNVGNINRMLSSYYQDYEDIRLVRVRQQHGMLVVIFDRKEKSRRCS